MDVKEIVAEINNIVARLNSSDPDVDFSRLSELLLKVKERRLWKMMVKDDGTPLRSFKDFLEYTGIAELPYYKVITVNRQYPQMLRAYTAVKEVLGSAAVEIGLRKSLEIYRLMKAGLAGDELTKWVELARETPWDVLRLAVTQALATGNKQVPVGRMRAVWALDEQWSVIDLAYQAYTNTTDSPYWGRFLELSAASFLASMGSETTIEALATALKAAIESAKDLTPEENVILLEIAKLWRSKLEQRKRRFSQPH